jgi:alanine racemase
VVPAPVVAPVSEAASWLEIDLATLVANARALAATAAPAALCAVVKSNAYGHGLVPVAAALTGSAIPGLRLAVFAAGEAFALRAAGIGLPILVLGPVADADLAQAAREGLELALLDERMVEPFARARVAAHLKVDTGTGRFGVPHDRAAGILNRCADLGVDVVGIYSHLASAEDIDTAFVTQQLERLQKVGRMNSAATFPHAKLHIAASAAAMMWPQTRLDMVRCGIAIYGSWPSHEVEAVMAGLDPNLALRPALRWFASIAQVRDVRAGESVGYSRTFVAQRDGRIAVLPVGYADGLPRAAGGGRLRVRIGDARAPIAGRVAMNACMIDVSDVSPPPQAGDRVEFEIEALAKAASTINYEILARLPEHLERRYT